MSGMHEMMSEYHEHCEKTAASMGQVRKSLADALESNDPAQMREAIDQADAPPGMMQERMSMCMKMMDMMHRGGMHGEGMSGMHGGEGMMGRDDALPRGLGGNRGRACLRHAPSR